MRFLEFSILGVLALYYIQKMVGLADLPLFAILNILVFLCLSAMSFLFYKDSNHPKKNQSTAFAIFFGIAFGLGILSIAIKVYNRPNWLAILFGLPNALFFIYLLIRYIQQKKNEGNRSSYFRGLLIRSGTVLTLSIIVVMMSFYSINKYLNRDQPEMYHNALAQDYRNAAKNALAQENYQEAKENIKLAIESGQIAWGNNPALYQDYYVELVDAYIEIIRNEFKEGNYDELNKLAHEIKRPLYLAYGKNSDKEAYLNTLLGEMNQFRGQYDDSDSLYTTALNMYKEHYGVENLYYCRTLKLLGNSFRERHYHRDAIEVFVAALNYLENDSVTYRVDLKSGKDAEMMAEDTRSGLYGELAWTYSRLQAYDTSEVYFQEAFDMDSVEQSESYFSLISYYAFHQYYQGNYKEAEGLMEKALAIVETKFGEMSYQYLNLLDGMSAIRAALAKYDKAEKETKKALGILKSMAPNNYHYEGVLLFTLAKTKYFQAQYDSAKVLLDEALAKVENNSMDYLDISLFTSRLNAQLDDLTLALRQAEQISGMAQNRLDPDNSYLSEYFGNEAYILYQAGNLEESVKLYEKCFVLDTLNNMQGTIQFASTLNGMGLVAIEKNEFNKADTLFAKAQDIFKNKLGKSHPLYANVLSNKAALKLAENKIEESEKLYKDALKVFQAVYQAEHDDLADIYVGLGKVAFQKGQAANTRKHYEKALKIYKKVFPTGHSKIENTKEFLIRLDTLSNMK